MRAGLRLSPPAGLRQQGAQWGPQGAGWASGGEGHAGEEAARLPVLCWLTSCQDGLQERPGSLNLGRRESELGENLREKEGDEKGKMRRYRVGGTEKPGEGRGEEGEERNEES